MPDKKLTDSGIVNNFCEVCGDNRFELIEKYKNELLEHTNIDTAKDEMAVIDSILFRFWQMCWLDKLEVFDRLQAENERFKNSWKADVILTIRTEAYKEFAKRLEHIIMWSPKNHISITAKDIDNLLKELVGEDNTSLNDKN